MTIPVSFMAVGPASDERNIAYLQRDGAPPGLFWLSGFRSDMTGTKAAALDDWAARNGAACTRFDYSGHGSSDGAVTDGSISHWLEEAKAVFETQTTGPQILVGSSMGGWIALLLARIQAANAGSRGSRIAGMVLIAPAVDFTERLFWDRLTEEQKTQLMDTGRLERPSDYSDEPYVFTRHLIEDGRNHLLLGKPVETGCPVHILQGLLDTDVPPAHVEEAFAHLAVDDALLTLIKDGDHRLSRPQDIALLIRAVETMRSDPD